MNLSQLLNTIKEGEIAQAAFLGENLFVTKHNGCLKYCSEDGKDVKDFVKLSFDMMEASFLIIG